jgi:Zn-dependent protease with chaperone function
MRALAIVGITAILVGVAVLSVAATGQGQSPAGVTPSAETPPPSPPPDKPVPVPEPSQKALDYYRSGNVLWVVGQIWGLAVPLVILFSGLSARLRTWAQRLGRKWFFVVALYLVFYSLLTYVIDWPLSYYAGYLRQHAYGLSNQDFGRWLGNSLKGLLIGLVFGALILWVPYLLLSKSPRRWWLYTSLLAVPLIFVVALVVPIWVEPLFNHYGPMKDRQLESQILALADRAGIEGSRVFEVDKSKDTKAVNAYVTGFWNTKRIVLWDTLLAKLQPGEVRFVMAHEMGHYVLGHVVQGILLSSLGILLSLYVVYRLSGFLIDRFQGRFGFDRLSDVASLPLILVLVQVVSLVVTPLALAYSRHIEHEADRFGLELTQNNHVAATAFVKLQTENLGIPRPGVLYMLWRGSHPSLGDRIDFANAYHPWKNGQPLRYGDRFRHTEPRAAEESR